MGVHHTSTKLGNKQDTMAHRPVEDGVCGEIFGVHRQIVQHAGPLLTIFVWVRATCTKSLVGVIRSLHNTNLSPFQAPPP